MTSVSLNKLPNLSDVEPADLINMDLPPVLWQFELPESLDQEKIVLNTGYLGLLQKIGAVSCSIVSSYQGERSEFTPMPSQN